MHFVLEPSTLIIASIWIYEFSLSVSHPIYLKPWVAGAILIGFINKLSARLGLNRFDWLCSATQYINLILRRSKILDYVVIGWFWMFIKILKSLSPLSQRPIRFFKKLCLNCLDIIYLFDIRKLGSVLWIFLKCIRKMVYFPILKSKFLGFKSCLIMLLAIYSIWIIILIFIRLGWFWRIQQKKDFQIQNIWLVLF